MREGHLFAGGIAARSQGRQGEGIWVAEKIHPIAYRNALQIVRRSSVELLLLAVNLENLAAIVVGSVLISAGLSPR